MKIISARGRKAGNPTQHQFTRDEIVELFNCRQNPVYFISNYIHFKDVSKTSPAVLNLHDYQADYVRTLEQNKSVIAMMPRQAGSTIVSVAYCLWEAMFFPDQSIMLSAINMQNVKMMCEMLEVMIDNLPPFMKSTVLLRQKTQLRFEGMSTINLTVMNPNMMRGRTLTRLYLDCFAYAPPPIQQGMWAAGAPGLANGCKVLITSVPNGPTNVFAQLWSDSQRTASYLTPFKRTIDDISKATTGWKQAIEAQIGKVAYAREFMCEFV